MNDFPKGLGEITLWGSVYGLVLSYHAVIEKTDRAAQVDYVGSALRIIELLFIPLYTC